MKERNYFIAGYRAAKKLEKLWNLNNFVCIPNPIGIDFFNTKETTPFDAVRFLSDEYDVPYSTVGQWIENIKFNDSAIYLN